MGLSAACTATPRCETLIARGVAVAALFTVRSIVLAADMLYGELLACNSDEISQTWWYQAP